MTQPSHPGSPPSPLTDDYLELLALASYNHRLENARALQRLR
jgi:hypothetical protein